MRAFLVAMHRWVGLFMAGFLIITGLTGAVISWDHELDEWLNKHLTHAKTEGEALATMQVIKQLEQRYPHMYASYFPLAVKPGHALQVSMQPRLNPETQEKYPTDFNQVFVDPVTGEVLGKREWGAIWPISKENFVSFLYKLHYSLHIPEFWGIDRWGIWLLGIVAMLWSIDCFTGFALTLPRKQKNKTRPAKKTAVSWLKRWQPAWAIRWNKGSYKLNFDLHQAVSLWTWLLLFIVAFTAFSLNLYREVFFPVMSLVSDVTPTVFTTRERKPDALAPVPQLSYQQAIAKAQTIATNEGWQEPVGSLFYSRNFGVYKVFFYNLEDDHGVGGAGHKAVLLDVEDGRELGIEIPWTGTAADIFVQAQFPLHSGRILGIPGRILISLMGLVVAMLSITGVIIWWRKLSARQKAYQKQLAKRMA